MQNLSVSLHVNRQIIFTLLETFAWVPSFIYYRVMTQIRILHRNNDMCDLNSPINSSPSDIQHKHRNLSLFLLGLLTPWFYFFFSAAAQLGGGVGSDNWIILSISNNVSISVSHPLVFINLARYPILGHSSSIASRLDGKLRRNIPSPKLSVLLTIAFFPSFASVLPSLPSNSQW